MATENDFLTSGDFTKEKLPGSINVLTILTFIGSAIGFIGSVYYFFSAEKSLKSMQDMVNSGKLNDAPEWAKNMVSADTITMYQKMADNKLPILLINLVGIALCVYGAMQMRKLKKQGYPLYVVGELLPYVATIGFVGTMAYKGFGLLGLIVPIVFILLYTVNKKYLIK